MGLKLEHLIKCFDNATTVDANYIAVLIEMKGSNKPEVIIICRENFNSKLEYYKKAYNEDLTLKACTDIKIVNFVFSNCFDDIEGMLLK